MDSFLDNKVFAGLSNGQLALFRRDAETGIWMTNDPQIIELSTSKAPVFKLMPVAGKLWSAIQNHIKIFNTSSMEAEVSLYHLCELRTV